MRAGKLPEGWVKEKLGLLAKTITKGTTPTTLGFEYINQGIPFIKVENIDDSGLSITSVHQFISEEAHVALRRSQLEENDILFSIAGTIGKTAVVKNQHTPANTNQAVAIIRGTNDVVLPDFLRQQLKFNAYKIFKESARGGAMNNVSLGDLKSVDFQFPHLIEQAIIVKKIDILLSLVESTKARLEQIPQILKRFRQAVLAAAVSGKLTEDYRENQVITSWDTTTLGTLIVDSCNGLAKRSGTDGEDITILRLADFKDAQRIHGNERKITLDSKEINKYSLKKNDVLVIRVNGSADLAGRFIEYKQNDDIEGFCDHFIRLRLNSEKISSRFLTFIANEGEGRFYLRNSLSTSAGQNTINQTSIKGLTLSLPPLLEQQEIVRRIEQLFAYADTIEKQVNSALTRVNILTQSILAKAFCGELSAQWRAENPDLISGENSAAALLEKIKAERAASGSKKAPRKKT